MFFLDTRSIILVEVRYFSLYYFLRLMRRLFLFLLLLLFFHLTYENRLLHLNLSHFLFLLRLKLFIHLTHENWLLHLDLSHLLFFLFCPRFLCLLFFILEILQFWFSFLGCLCTFLFEKSLNLFEVFHNLNNNKITFPSRFSLRFFCSFSSFASFYCIRT